MTVNGNTITFKAGSAPAAAVPAGYGVEGNVVTDGNNIRLSGDTTTPAATVADLARRSILPAASRRP